MELSYVAAAVTLRFEDVADADCIFSKGALRPVSHAVESDSASFRIHSCEENSSVGAAQRTIAHGIGKHNGLRGKTVKVWRMDRVCLPAHIRRVFRLVPEGHGRIAELIRENINYVRKLFLSLAAGCCRKS